MSYDAELELIRAREHAAEMAKPVGERVSYALTEARTVLSRAQTAITDVTKFGTDDPDSAGILRDLSVAVAVLRKYKRTKRR